ncbi:MAG TPA: Rieske (2Fe-2S) protein, partial [Burkholderiaceae bacterium]|nr:Rieske (2Fe-2S) protein [Burkholderiaceae bacterium]
MPLHPPPAPPSTWHAVIGAADLHAKGRAVVRVAQKQIALFAAGEHVYACNNRCPHEGYPLVEGTLEGACQLTCQWHNWSFALDSGANRYGGDRLRVYPTRIADGQVWVDVADPPAAQRIEAALSNLRQAFADDDAPRMARELARLQKAGGDPLDAVR